LENQQIVTTADKSAGATGLNELTGKSTAHPLLPLVVDRLCYDAGGSRVMDKVSFTLDGAARTVVLGPNGAGKSILLRLCNGLLQPTSGTIAWNGFCAADASRRQSMVFQRPVLLRRSAAANIAHALKISGVPRAHRTDLVEKALLMAGLGQSGRQPARSLSGGEQQRLSIARAAVLEPDVLLLDEPTSNLDPGATRVVEELIRDVDSAGTKIIMTTHDIGQARRLADEVLFLHRGLLLEKSTAEAFFNGPVDRSAARFLEGKLLE
jgi:tungstate transport system ATP-binding protein